MPRNLLSIALFSTLLVFSHAALSLPERASWTISAETVLPGGEPANAHIASLIEKLARDGGEGLPVSAEELREYCDRADPAVDGEALLRYAAPGSVSAQNMDHARYARILMSAARVEAGADFLREQDRLLRRAQARYGVARQDIVAILMWESALGRIVGETRVFNVLLAQLLYLEDAHAFAVEELRGADRDGPGRSFRDESGRFEKLERRAVDNLTALLRLAKEKGQDPTALRGSWAGAIGYPQFMPASLKYAVDGDGDGVIDLNHWPDAVFSVANYLHESGYDMSYAGRKRGIHRYNPIDSYVHGVIRYADAIIRR